MQAYRGRIIAKKIYFWYPVHKNTLLMSINSCIYEHVTGKISETWVHSAERTTLRKITKIYHPSNPLHNPPNEILYNRTKIKLIPQMYMYTV